MKVMSEDYECAALVRWLKTTKLLFSHVPSGAYMNVATATKMQRLGVVRGVPDYVIVDPTTHKQLWVEMKRTTGGVVSAEQKAWIKALGNACVCNGYQEARSKIAEYFGVPS